jgi:hypothetical protein
MEKQLPHKLPPSETFCGLHSAKAIIIVFISPCVRCYRAKKWKILFLRGHSWRGVIIYSLNVVGGGFGAVSGGRMAQEKHDSLFPEILFSGNRHDCVVYGKWIFFPSGRSSIEKTHTENANAL